MWFYSLFVGQGRDLLAEALSAREPFDLSAEEIVERVLDAGFTPVIDEPRRTRFPAPGVIHTVERDGRVLLVAVHAGTATITVQEAREDPYTAPT